MFCQHSCTPVQKYHLHDHPCPRWRLRVVRARRPHVTGRAGRIRLFGRGMGASLVSQSCRDRQPGALRANVHANFRFSRDRSPFTGWSEASFGPNLEPADLGKPGTTIAERPNAPKKPRAGQATSFNLVAWTLHLVGLCSCRQERRSPFIKLRVETEPVEPVKLILFKASLEKMCSRCCCLDCPIVYTRRRCIASTTKHHLKSR